MLRTQKAIGVSSSVGTWEWTKDRENEAGLGVFMSDAIPMHSIAHWARDWEYPARNSRPASSDGLSSLECGKRMRIDSKANMSGDEGS